MFGNKRRVDLGGRRGPNRRKLLEDTRKQRAIRLQQQREKNAAIKIQAFYRGTSSLKKERDSHRQQWDSLIAELQKTQITTISSTRLRNATRQFLFFFSWQQDSGRLLRLCRMLYQSINKSPLENNYLNFLAEDGERLRAGMVQIRKLLTVLLSYVRERLQAKDKVSSPLALLLFIIDLRQMACLAKAGGQLGGRIKRNHLGMVIHHISKPPSVFFESLRSALIRVTDSQEMKTEAKLVAATLLATAMRPISVWSFEDVKMRERQLQGPHTAFVVRILSIPALTHRLTGIDLGRMAMKIAARSVWTPLMAAFAKSREGGSGVGLEEPVGVEMKEGGVGTRALCILGNVLELGVREISNASLEEKAVYFAAIEALVRRIEEIPGDLSPQLKSQLQLLQDKLFLNAMTACVRGLESRKHRVVFRLCGSLAFKFRSIRTSMLNAMVFSSSIISELYSSMAKAGIFSKSAAHGEWGDDLREKLTLFCICYNHLLLIQDDAEFFDEQKPCSLKQITEVVRVLKRLLQQLYWEGGRGGGKVLDSRNLSVPWAQLRDVATDLFCQLRVRQSRKQFCERDIWIMPKISFPVFKNELESKNSGRAARILRRIPFVLTFQQRVELFYGFIRSDRKHMDSAGVNFQHGAGVGIRVRRDRVLTDGFESLTKIGQNIKGRVQVQFINSHGIPETGIDGGGLFKEFVTELLRSAFDPQLGLFCQTPHEFTYPNPTSFANPNFGEQHLAYFQFVGMVVGKCLYDGIILEPQFANFFLRKLLGYRNFVDDLSSLDPEVYKNLLYLKKNSASGLGLTFSVARDTFGDSKVVDLIPNGSNIAVTDQNRLRFIYEMADFKLNREIAPQSKAFVAGLNSVIKPDWLRMFEAEELDRLVSGTPVIDVADLKRHTNYAGGYDENHEVIRWFWSILDNDMDESDRRSFLKFSTSVSRSPLLGFRHLYPKFCIQRSSGDTDNLPTSSTCMNLLKLPRYATKAKLREKLLYSIKSSSGFYLT